MGSKTTRSSTQRERTPPWAAGAKSDRTRNQIVDGARLAFQDFGFANTRVEQITQRAGVSRPTFYVYFATKRDAFLAVAERSVDELATVLDALDTVPPRPSDPQLARWLETIFLYFDEFGAFATVWRQAAFTDSSMQGPGWHAQKRWGKRFGQNMDRLRGRTIGDPSTQGLAAEAMLESLWFSSTMTAGRRNRDAMLDITTTMFRALID